MVSGALAGGLLLPDRLIFRFCVFSRVLTGEGDANDPWLRSSPARASPSGLSGFGHRRYRCPMAPSPNEKARKVAAAAKPVSITVGDGKVSGLWLRPPDAIAAMVIAHGAGAGMNQRFLEATALGLADRSVATLRYQFPYMEAGRGRPDSPAVATSAVRAASEAAAKLGDGLPLFAGGKSFGGRMTSTAESEKHLDGIGGLFFLGFPLHAPGKHTDERGEHLKSVKIPMLFLQGTRDDFAKLELLEPLVKKLGRKATLKTFDGADHSFHVPKTSGKTDSGILTELLDTLVEWASRLVAGPQPL